MGFTVSHASVSERQDSRGISGDGFEGLCRRSRTGWGLGSKVKVVAMETGERQPGGSTQEEQMPSVQELTGWGKWGLSPKLWAGLREGAYPRAGVGCRSGDGAAWGKGEGTDLGLNLGTEV